jgi:hypothetical protein
MLKKIFLILCLLIANNFSYAHPQDGMTQQQLMFYYVKMFNEENLAALQDIYHYPHVRLINGKLVKFEDKSIPAVDFESLKKTGWKYSKINSVKVLAESTNSAMVEMDFSRFDKDDKEFYRSTGYYVLTKNLGYWQILSLISIGNVAGMNK